MEIGPDIAACLPGGSPGTLGVAVSGGSDSTTLLVLLAEWAKSANVAISAVTVDHDLRPGSAGNTPRAVKGPRSRLRRRA